ncbi:MAG: NuoM family protein [Cyclobacteriaceae bacterium]|jgi:NADH-quinone oxidoreductase subunit M
MPYLLSLLIFSPLAAALFAGLLPAHRHSWFRALALAVSIGQVLALIALFNSLSPNISLYYAEQAPWLNLSLGTWGVLQASYLVAVDGLSLPLVALSVVVLLIAVISSWREQKNVKGYFMLLLTLNGAIIGSFCALDMLLFYVFFEFMLIPMYFLIGIWGGARREYASVKFFLYTLLGSILILIVFIGLYLGVGVTQFGQILHSFSVLDWQDKHHHMAGSWLASSDTFGGFTLKAWAFFLLLAGFGIKLPMVPFHTWLPDAHVEASTPISVILAALLLKVGGYGLARVVVPVFPSETIQFSGLLGALGVISIIYGGFNALASKDLKRLIAYSSVSHMGFVLLGLASGTTEGIAGSIYQMVSHGIITSMLFLIAGVLYDRTHDRLIDNYSGLSTVMPRFAAVIMIAFFAGMGLPGFSGFIAEVLVLLGAFNPLSLLPVWLPVLAATGLLLAAGYFAWTIQRMLYGAYVAKGFSGTLADLTSRERFMLVSLAIVTLWLGILPQGLLNFINPFAEGLARILSEYLVP